MRRLSSGRPLARKPGLSLALLALASESLVGESYALPSSRILLDVKSPRQGNHQGCRDWIECFWLSPFFRKTGVDTLLADIPVAMGFSDHERNFHAAAVSGPGERGQWQDCKLSSLGSVHASSLVAMLSIIRARFGAAAKALALSMRAPVVREYGQPSARGTPLP